MRSEVATQQAQLRRRVIVMHACESQSRRSDAAACNTSPSRHMTLLPTSIEEVSLTPYPEMLLQTIPIQYIIYFTKHAIFKRLSRTTSEPPKIIPHA
jgi:type VI protein secretion system component VasA